jgi:hypothetical protein
MNKHTAPPPNLYGIICMCNSVFYSVTARTGVGVVRYHSGGSMKLRACILLLAHMVYL